MPISVLGMTFFSIPKSISFIEARFTGSTFGEGALPVPRSFLSLIRVCIIAVSAPLPVIGLKLSGSCGVRLGAVASVGLASCWDIGCFA